MSAYLDIEAYHRPRDQAQAVEILARYGKRARVIAGGTDILPLRPGVKQNDNIHAGALDMPLNKVRVIKPHTGGSFGGRCGQSVAGSSCGDRNDQRRR